ncbi:MAG: hypothetical protein AAGA46_08805 [Cyanobacteria bacterium P01_F01_bin.13]
MSPVFFIAMPFILLLLMSQSAGASQAQTSKGPKGPDEQDGDIIIIRKKK